MNNTFDWNRFKKVVAMDWRGMWNRYGMTMLIVVLVPVAIWIVCLLLNMLPDANIETSPAVRIGMLIFTMLLCAILAPSGMYKNCNLPKDGIYYAMLPASHIEKYMSQILYCVIVSPLLCLAGGIVIDLILTVLPIGPYKEWLFADWGVDIQAIYAEIEEGGEVMETVKYVITQMIVAGVLGYLFYAAAFMFTNTIFKSHKVLKTILAFIVINFVLSPIGNVLVLANADRFINMATENITSTMKWMMLVSNIINALMTAGLFVWTYFRLKRMKY